MLQLTFWCKRADLHHEPENVHDDARVFDSAILKTVQHHPSNLYGTSCSRHTQEVASVRTRPLEPSQYLIAFGNLFFDREMQVRKRRPHASGTSFNPSRRGPWPGNGTCSTTSSQTNSP